ncbi:choline transporter-like protein 2 [Patiria miniata]|uniref:Choline transporter-like protein n=1 Tax=Patiria miniata TaxID=46514 RepID=A0A913Z1L1_PATMI|nr:choline transporter-like protein 2 [Patiria miniata]
MGKDKYQGDDENAEMSDAPPPGRTQSKKFGKCKKYDPAFHGPIENRSCTDIICCILFIVFFIGMIVVGGIGWIQGDPLTLIYATDSMGNVCGKSTGYENKPNLFYFDLLECFTDVSILELGCPSAKVCLAVCPTETFAPYTLALKGQLPVDIPIGDAMWDKFICLDGFNATTEYNTVGGTYSGPEGLAKMFEDKKCAAYYIESEPFADRCIPAFLVNANASAGDILAKGLNFITTVGGENLTDDTIVSKLITAAENFLDLRSLFSVVYQDFVSSWYIILIGLSAGMILALVWIIIMRWIAGVMTWLSILGLWAILGAGIYCCWQQYIYLEQVQSGTATMSMPGTAAVSSSMVSAFISGLSGFLRLQKTWLAFGIALSILLLIIVLVTLCLCSRIRIAVQLIKESSRAVGSMLSTLFWPIVPFLLQVVIITLWATIAVFLATSHKATFVVYQAPGNFSLANGTECVPEEFQQGGMHYGSGASCMFQSYALPDYVIYLQFYNLFGLFWLMEFVVALGQVTLSGAFASYYWAYHKPNDIPALPLWGGFYRAIRYHLGSIAFGSLIIAIIKIIRVLLEYAEVQLKKGKDNKVVSFILKCLKCCFYCLEKFMKFLNKNAYIMIAIYGKNFCSSAKTAFFLLMRNIVRVAVINKITDFLILLGILCITGGVSVAAFFFFTNQITWVSSILDVPEVNYYWVVIIVIGLGVYVIAKCFFNVFDMAVDTMFLCFLEDLERHDGSAEKPYYMSKSMMKICGKKNKKPMTDNEDEDECEW